MNPRCEVLVMDDLIFRRSIYADPKTSDPEILEAIKNDPQKQKLANDLGKFDDKIFAALSVDVPSDLANKLMLRQTMADHTKQKKKSRIHLALAASVVFTVGVTMNMFQFSSSYNNLGDHSLAHVHYENGSFKNMATENITLESVNKRLANFGGNFTSLVGEVISADFCRFDGIKSLHLVFQGENSPVTVFVIPHEDSLTVKNDFSDAKYDGKTIQYLQSNIVVITEKDESVNEWQSKINQNIEWST